MRPLACLPDPVGRAVLHAALDPPERALQAWRRVRSQLDLDAETWATEAHRLLPLVYRNLESQDLDDADRAGLHDRYERTRQRNEERVRVAGRWLQLLALGGVPASVLKGLPLMLRDYGDLGVRPMADIDLLVDAEHATRALDLLEGAGWHDAGDASREALALLYHGSGLLHPDGWSIDVHWHLAGFFTAGFHPHLEPIRVGEADTTTLDRTDTLLHVCLHGAWNGSGATTRWVADAVTVARAAAAAGEPLDRDRFLAVGEAYGVGAILGTALQHLVAEHDAPLPTGLPVELQAQRPTWRVRHRQRVVTTPDEGSARLAGLRHLRSYWAYTRWGWDDRQAMRAFPAFLVELWHLDSPRDLPAALVTRPARRLLGRTG